MSTTDRLGVVVLEWKAEEEVEHSVSRRRSGVFEQQVKAAADAQRAKQSTRCENREFTKNPISAIVAVIKIRKAKKVVLIAGYL